MPNQKKDRKTISYPIKQNVNIGEVRISDEVVVTIAALAATEVDGIHSLFGNITNSSVSKLGLGKLLKGIRINMGRDSMSIACGINIKEGYNIPQVSKEVQEHVKGAVENMTGLSVSHVNIRIGKVMLES